MKRNRKLTHEEYSEYMHRELAEAHTKYPFTEEIRRELWRKIRAAERGGGEHKPMVSKSFRWAPFAWGIGVAGALLVSLGLFLPWSGTGYRCSVALATTRGQVAEVPDFLNSTNCTVHSDFGSLELRVKFPSGFELRGSLTITSAEGAERLYQYKLGSIARDGIVVSGSGVLQIVATEIAKGTPVDKLKRSDFDIFRLNLNLSNAAGAYPPIVIELPDKIP